MYSRRKSETKCLLKWQDSETKASGYVQDWLPAVRIDQSAIGLLSRRSQREMLTVGKSEERFCMRRAAAAGRLTVCCR